jgi:hypothetical protein
MPSIRVFSLVGLALVVTVLNACKPFTIDDAIYHLYAEHLAQQPLDPYGFTFYGSNEAMLTLVPPGLPYYEAAALRLVGDNPVLCKLALFPLSLVLVLALHALLRRLACGLEMSMTALVVLSPVTLPCWNYMLDLPALALGLAALAVYLAACDRSSFLLALLAGLLGGVAMQTKYTTFTIPAIVLLHGVLYRQVGRAVLAVGLMVGVFVAWESWLIHLYGVSHFQLHLGRQNGDLLRKLRLVLPLISTLGAVAPWLALLALAALGSRARVLVGVGLAYALAVLLIALVPADRQVLLRSSPDGPVRLELAGLLWGLFGVIVCGGGCAVLVRKFRDSGAAERRRFLFLTGWLTVEILAYFAMTPFPAVRRVLGVCVVGTLLAAHVAVRPAPDRDRGTRLRAVAAAGILLGLGFQALDCWEAHVEQKAVRRAAHRIRRTDPTARIWYGGNGSTGTFYARWAGMVHNFGQPTRPGDWYVLEERAAPGPPPDWQVELRGRLAVGNGPPLSTMPNFHGSGTPLAHHEGPRLVLLLYRRK